MIEQNLELRPLNFAEHFMVRCGWSRCGFAGIDKGEGIPPATGQKFLREGWKVSLLQSDTGLPGQFFKARMLSHAPEPILRVEESGSRRCKMAWM